MLLILRSYIENLIIITMKHLILSLLILFSLAGCNKENLITNQNEQLTDGPGNKNRIFIQEYVNVSNEDTDLNYYEWRTVLDYIYPGSPYGTQTTTTTTPPSVRNENGNVITSIRFKVTCDAKWTDLNQAGDAAYYNIHKNSSPYNVYFNLIHQLGASSGTWSAEYDNQPIQNNTTISVTVGYTPATE